MLSWALTQEVIMSWSRPRAALSITWWAWSIGMMVIRRASATDRNVLYLYELKSATSNLIPTMVIGWGILSWQARTPSACSA
jgi:hypothetical protein